MQPNPIFNAYSRLYWEKYHFRKIASAIGTAFLLMTLLPYALSIGIRFVMGAQPDLLTRILGDPYGELMLQLVFSISMFSVPYAVAVWMQRRRLSDVIAFAKPKQGRFVPLVLIGFSLCMAANLLGGMFTRFLSSIGLTAEMSDLPMPTGFAGVLLTVLTVAVEPALMEEFALRGVVLGSLRRYGDGIAVLISAILFSAMHGNLEQIPFTFLVGVVLGVVYVKTNSIWTAVAIHFLNNLLSVILSYVIDHAGLSMSVQTAVEALVFLGIFMLGFLGLRMLAGREEDIFTFKAQTDAPRMPYLRWFFSVPTVIAGLALIALQILILIIGNLLPGVTGYAARWLF